MVIIARRRYGCVVVTLNKKNFKIKSVEKDDAVSNEVFLTALAKILAKDFMRQREEEREGKYVY